MKRMQSSRGRQRCLEIAALALSSVLLAASNAHAQARKPNIVVIFGDDIGMWNVGR